MQLTRTHSAITRLLLIPCLAHCYHGAEIVDDISETTSSGTATAATTTAATTGEAGTTADPDEGGDTNDNGVVVNPDALVVDQALADVVVVGEESLQFPAAGFDEAMAEVFPGAIVVGPPHSAYAESNAAGFLRRVEKVEYVGDRIDVVTSQATLEDVFQDVDTALAMASPQAAFSLEGPHVRTAPWLEIFESPPMLDGGIGFDFSGTSLLDEPGLKVTLDKGYLRVKPDLAFKVKIKWFKLKYLLGEISAPYDAGLAVSATLDVAGDKHFEKTLIDNKKIATTKFSVAGIPLVFVLRMTIDVACDVSGSAKATAGAGIRYYGSPSAGVKYESKEWTAWKNLDFNHKEAAGAEVFAEAEVACEAPRVRLEYKLYDVAGPYATVAPTLDADLSASFDAQTCEAASCSFHATVTPGLKFVVGFLVKVLGKTLVDKHAEFPITWSAWATEWACDAGWMEANCAPGEPPPDEPDEDGILAMTPTCYPGTDITSIAWADAQCASAFGPAWSWLEFHHDGGWQTAGPWRDATGIGERGWVSIDDKPAECFEAGSGLTWIRAAEDGGAGCFPGTGLEGPEYTPHSGACNPYIGDTPCGQCRRLICSAN